MTCPDCKGTKVTIASHVTYADGRHGYDVAMKCIRCVGTGEVPDAMADWILAGEAMRNARILSNRSLREEATRRGMDVVTLSKMEWGKIEPIPEQVS